MRVIDHIDRNVSSLYQPGGVDCLFQLSAVLKGCAQAARAFTSLFMKKEK
jgi:hypothetical protein